MRGGIGTMTLMSVGWVSDGHPCNGGLMEPSVDITLKAPAVKLRENNKFI